MNIMPLRAAGRQCALLVAVVLLWMPGAYAQPPVPVIVHEVRVDRFVDRVEALGTLRANESVELTAAVAERVTGIHFEDGQRVRAGQILVEMTSGEEHALLEEETSKAEEARKQYERLLPLLKRRAISVSEVDERRREYETARARLRAIESKLQDRLVVAPFDGVLGLRQVSVGALIEPGDAVTTLDDDSVMKLDFTVPAVHLASLRAGLPIEALSPAFPGRSFEGTVSSIDSRIDPVTRSITIRARLPNPEKLLKPGLLMQVALLRNARQALVISEAALIPKGRGMAVMVVDRSVDPPVARRRAVETGQRRPGEVEITSGLQAGEFVVLHGTLLARDGRPVKILAEAQGDEPLSELLDQKRQAGAHP